MKLRLTSIVSSGLLLLLLGLVATASAAAPDRPLPFSVNNLPNPRCISGAPLQICVASDSSIQVSHSSWPNGQVYGWQSSDADSGIWLWAGSDVFGPDACYSARITKNLYTVKPWTAVSHSGPTGSGSAGDPWVVTTVLGAGSSGIQVTQRVSYVNGQAYFRLQWDVKNSGSSQAVSLFHAVDSYFADSDYGIGYYDPTSGAVGGRADTGNWYMLFVPETPATSYREGWYFDVWNEIGYCGDSMTCPVSGGCSQGTGLSKAIDTTAVDNGFGLQWQRTVGAGATVTLSDWWTFGATPVIPGGPTATPTATATRTPTPTVTRTSTPTATSTTEVCNQTISAPFGPPSAANSWQRFTIPLTAATFNVDSATFQKVMSQVTFFRIRTEMHDGSDVGGVDNVAVGSRFSTGFDAGPEGWTAAGDGTMEWKSSGGNPGGYLQISDWATGDWHWAVAPVSWAGDWRNVIGANIGFDVKTNYPDYASVIEISCTPTKRLTLTANPFVIPAGGSSNMTVSLSESAPQAVVVSLSSSAPSCITVPASVTVAQGQTSAAFIAQAAAGATPGCEAVIEASQATYGTARLTLHVAASTATPTMTATPTATMTGSPTPTPTATVGKPDLTIISLDRNGVAVDLQALTLSGSLGVQLQNQGNQAVTQNFRVAVFEDRDLNRTLTAGTDVVLGQRDHTGVFGAGASEWFSVSVSGNVLFRDNLIYAFVDSQNAVAESDETNNTYDTGLLCRNGQQSHTYTTDADFDQGILFNVNHDAPNNNQLQLNKNLKAPAFIWVALSGRGEIAKIDVNTGQVKGRYLSAPDGRSRNPSRTTVDLYGNVWAGNRDEGADGKGSAVHIGLAENFQCVDRNGNGVIDTSTGEDVKPWPNTNGVDSDGGVETAQDECIIHYVRAGSAGTRHVSVDKNNNVWISGNLFYNAGDRYFDLVDGGSGALLRRVGPFTCGGYGGLVDRNGVLWSATGNNDWAKLLRYDPASGAATCLDVTYSYGLAIDSQGNIWNSLMGQNIIKKFSPAGQIIGSYASSGSNPGGLAVSLADNNVWVANRTSANLTRLNANGNIVATIPVGGSPTGVAVDVNGKIWSVNMDSNNLMRINPQTNQVDLTVGLPSGSAPYNYSDMTGTQILGVTAPQGTWTVIYDSGAAGTPWGKIAWNSQEPVGSSVTARARSADTQAGLNAATYVSAANGVEKSLGSGRYLQVQIILAPGDNNASPIVYDVTLFSRPSAADVTASYIRITDNAPASVTFTARIGNGGSKGIPADMPVAFYDGNPAAGGSLLGVVRTTKALAPGEYVDVSFTWNSPPGGSRVVYVRADDNGAGVGSISECNENNNIHSLPYQIAGGTMTPTPTATRTPTATATRTPTPTATGTVVSGCPNGNWSKKIALVPSASGQFSPGASLPTSGTEFGGMTFTELPAANVSAASLAGFDTVVLNQICDANTRFNASQKAAINQFVAAGGKLLIYDSDGCAGSNTPDYGWLVFPFRTNNPGQQGASGGTLTIVEENTLSSNNPASPYFIDVADICKTTDAVGDANVMLAQSANWCGDMQATNVNKVTGWTHTYGRYGSGLMVYDGMDIDNISSNKWLRKVWLLELCQAPAGNLPCGVPVPPITPTPTPTATRTATPTVTGPPPLPDLTVSQIEINQAVQNAANSIPLIAMKRTVVRAYIGIAPAAGPIDSVTGVLRVYRGAQLLGAVDPFNPGQRIRAYAAPDWRQLNQALNFEVPFGWLTGDLRFEVEVNHDRSVTELNYGNNRSSATGHFVDGGDLRVAWLPIRYTAAGYTGPQNPGSRIAQGDAWLKATYPLSHVRVKYYPWPGITWGGDVNFGTGGVKLLAYLSRLLQLSQTQPRPDHIYGWLPSGVFGGNGLAWLPGQAAFGNDTDGRWRRTFAHEVGHNRNLGHWDATIGVHGFDVAAREVREDTRLDFMVPGRLENEAWVAPGVYNYLHDHMSMASDQSAGSASVAAGAATEYLLVGGIVGLDGSADLSTFYRLTQTDPMANPPDGNAYCVEQRGVGGAVLASKCFDVSFEYGDSTAPMSAAPFGLTVPYQPGTKEIALTRGGNTIGKRMVSSNGPQVTAGAPTGGTIKRFTWSASDLDNDPLSFSLLYSPNGKLSWQAVAADLSQTTFDLDTATLTGGDSAYLRIVATDGVNTAFQDVGPFSVGDKGPLVSIESPLPGAVYVLGETVLLAGSAFDPEDGDLPDTALTWSSNVAGALGTGSWLERNDLSLGQHVITLSAVDSKGHTATASVTITIRRPYVTYLPLILRRYPLPVATPTPTATAVPPRTATPTASPTIPAATGLYGRVTKGGAAAAGVTLSLRRYDDTTDDEVATTVTGTDGRYLFAAAPTLPAGFAYYVLYGLNHTDPSNVFLWYGPDVTAYTAGAYVAAGDFDIANVALLSPASGATVTLPATFTWQRRGLSSDTYQVIFEDSESGDWWQTSDLGNVGSYTMPGLGSGMAYGTVYDWYIRIFRGSDSWGISYYYREVTFQASNSATGPENARPVELIPKVWSGPRWPDGSIGVAQRP